MDPGEPKTFICAELSGGIKAVAGESGAPFFSMGGSELKAIMDENIKCITEKIRV